MVVAPKVSGYVEQVLVVDNQDVKAGDPLVRIDPRDYRAKSEQAQAQIAQADASVQNARAGIAEQYAAIDQARAQLAAARAKAAHDAAEVARYTPLAASGAETRQQLAQLTVTARQSADDARAQAATLVAQERKIASLRAQVGQARAQGEGARAQLSAAQVDVGATLIRSAINGRIGDKTVVIGQYAQAGTRLMSVVPLNRLYITANFKETQLALMRPGPAGDDFGRRTRRNGRAWPGGERVAGNGRAILAVAAAERDRQLHQDRTARACPHLDRGDARRAAPARPRPVSDGVSEHDQREE